MMYNYEISRQIPSKNPVMAYIRKRGKSFYVEIQRQGIRRTATFDTKTDAIQWAGNIEADIVAGKRKALIPDLTFGELLERYAKEVSPTKRGERWERIRINKIQEDPISQIKLDTINERHVSEWRDRRLKTISNESVRREWTLLSAACSVALKEWKWLEFHPMKNVRRPPQGIARDRLITDDEIETLLYVLGYKYDEKPKTTSARIGAAFLFAIETAMRKGEIVNLTWDKVYLNRQVAHLDKTKTDKRDVPLSREAVRILKQLDTGYKTVFGLESGTLDALFRRAKKRAGIVNLKFHDTRHEAITRLSKKLTPLELARMVGHRNLNQLLTYYNETPEELAKKLG